MIGFINAKINIGLRITGKRADGYHNLETIFYPIGKGNGTPSFPFPFGDVLEIVPSKKNSFQTIGISAGCSDEENIIVKARNLFSRKFEEKTGRRIRESQIVLEKLLPNGAGLGGGSSDASFTLRMLNEINGFAFSNKELESQALQLGADCPFFIENRPALGKGVGEILSPVALNLENFIALIVKPEVSISTREAFENISIREYGEDLRELVSLPIGEWQGRIKNSFEESLFPRYPELEAIKEKLISSGALYASMSGSGSALYGIFENVEKGKHASREFGNSMTFIASLRP